MRNFLASVGAALFAAAAYLAPSRADDMTLLGVANSSAAAGGSSYVQNFVHFDPGVALIPTVGTTTATQAFYKPVAILATSTYGSGSATLNFTGSTIFPVGQSVYVVGSSLSALNGGSYTITSSAAGTVTISCATACSGSGTFTAVGNFGSNSVTVNSCPTGIQTGNMIFDKSIYPTSGQNQIGLVVSCTGGVLTFAANQATVPYSRATNTSSYGSSDALAIGGPIAASDSCQVIYSQWFQGSLFWSSALSTNFVGFDFASSFTDFLHGGSAGTPPYGAAGEITTGLDIVEDNNGLRLSAGNSAPNSGTNSFEATMQQQYLQQYFPYGQPTHLLWTLNTCGSSTTGHAYMGLAINGVNVPTSVIGAGNTSMGNINLSNSAGGLVIIPSNSDTWGNFNFADIMAWSGFDLICKTRSASYPSCTGNTLSQADINQFGQQANVSNLTASGTWGASSSTSPSTITINSSLTPCPAGGVLGQTVIDTAPATPTPIGIAQSCSGSTLTLQAGQATASSGSSDNLRLYNWVPKAPSAIATAVYNEGVAASQAPTLLYDQTGSASNFPTTVSGAPGLNQATAPALQKKATQSVNLTDLTSSASYVSPSNTAGCAPHTACFKWWTSWGGGGTTAYSQFTAGQIIQAGDLLVSVGEIAYNSAIPTGAYCAPPNNTVGAWKPWIVETSLISGIPSQVCAFYYIAQAGDIALQTFTGASFGVYTGARTERAMLFDYGSTNGVTVDGTPTSNNVVIGTATTGSVAGTSVALTGATCTVGGRAVASPNQIYDLTSGQPIGQVASCVSGTVTLTSGMPQNTVSSGDSLMISGNFPTASSNIAAQGFSSSNGGSLPAGTGDLVVGLWVTWITQTSPYDACPSTYPARYVTSFKTPQAVSAMLVCDSGTGIAPPTSAVNATHASADRPAGGGLLALKPN